MIRLQITKSDINVLYKYKNHVNGYKYNMST